MPLLSRILSPRRPRLEQLLEKASRHPRHREEFYHALLEEDVWVPGRIADGEVFIEPYELNGRTTILLFTSERHLTEALRSAVGAIALPGRALLEALPPFDALLLEFATRLQKEMTPSEVAALLDGSIFGLLRDDDDVERTMLGRPKHYPVALMDELRPLLASLRDVRAAYLCQAQHEGDATPQIIIGIDGSMESLATIATFTGARDPSVRVVAMADDAVSEYMRRETEAWWP
jgi:hypothetical protein